MSPLLPSTAETMGGKVVDLSTAMNYISNRTFSRNVGELELNCFVIESQVYTINVFYDILLWYNVRLSAVTC